MSLVDDIAIIIGTGLVAYGGYLVHPSLCWLAVGFVLMGVGIGGQFVRGKGKGKETE